MERKRCLECFRPLDPYSENDFCHDCGTIKINNFYYNRVIECQLTFNRIFQTTSKAFSLDSMKFDLDFGKREIDQFNNRVIFPSFTEYHEVNSNTHKIPDTLLKYIIDNNLYHLSKKINIFYETHCKINKDPVRRIEINWKETDIPT